MLLSVVNQPLQITSTRNICEWNNTIKTLKTMEGFKKILRMQKVPTKNLRGSFYILKRNLNLHCENIQTYANHLYEEVCENCKNSHSLKFRLRMQKVPSSFLRGSFYILKRNLNCANIQFANYGNYLVEGYTKDCKISQKFKKILRMQKVPLVICRGSFYILKRNLNLHCRTLQTTSTRKIAKISKSFKKILRMQKVPTENFRGSFYILKRNLNLIYRNIANHTNYLIEEVCKVCNIATHSFKKILRMQKVPLVIQAGSFYILKRNLKNYANYLYEEIYNTFKEFKFRLRMQKEPLSKIRGSFYILKITLNELSQTRKLPRRGILQNCVYQV